MEKSILRCHYQWLHQLHIKVMSSAPPEVGFVQDPSEKEEKLKLCWPEDEDFGVV